MTAHRAALQWCCAVTAVVLAASGAEGQVLQQGSTSSTRSALVYHGRTSFFVNAPNGWVIDDSDAARAQGPMAVLYRRGESWRSAEAVMYANVLTLLGTGPNALATTIDAEVARWSASAGDAVVTPLIDIRTGTGEAAKVRKFVSRSRRTHEVVAYIRNGSTVPILVVLARSEEALVDAYPDFVRLVKSYAPGPLVRK
jgi:hypothetical protein